MTTNDPPTPLEVLIRLAASEEEGVSTPLTRDDARAILALLSDANRDRGKWQGIAESKAGEIETARRWRAEADQIRASADNVAHNADLRIRRMWLDYVDMRSRVVALLGVMDSVYAHEPKVHLADREHEIVKSAREAVAIVVFEPKPP